MNQRFTLAVALAVTLFGGRVALAGPVLHVPSSGPGKGALATATLNDLNPESLSTGDFTVSFVTDAGFVTGETEGINARPYFSGANDAGFGGLTGEDLTQYATTGSDRINDGAMVTITFSQTQQYFGLLWGSLDKYNRITFYDEADAVTASYTGEYIGGLLMPEFTAWGNQDEPGTIYANFGGAYKKIEFTSVDYAFEFDNIAYARDEITTFSTVPDGGATLSLLGGGLMGLVMLRRKFRV